MSKYTCYQTELRIGSKIVAIQCGDLVCGRINWQPQTIRDYRMARGHQVPVGWNSFNLSQVQKIVSLNLKLSPFRKQ